MKKVKTEQRIISISGSVEKSQADEFKVLCRIFGLAPGAVIGDLIKRQNRSWEEMIYPTNLNIKNERNEENVRELGEDN